MSIPFRIIILVLTLASTLSFGGMIVQVQVIEEKAAPSTRPTAVAAAPEVLVSVEARVENSGDFLARTQTGTQTIELKGSLAPLEDKYACKINFDNREKLGLGQTGTSVATSIHLGVGESTTIGGVGKPGGAPPQQKIVLTLKPEMQAPKR